MALSSINGSSNQTLKYKKIWHLSSDKAPLKIKNIVILLLLIVLTNACPLFLRFTRFIHFLEDYTNRASGYQQYSHDFYSPRFPSELFPFSFRITLLVYRFISNGMIFRRLADGQYTRLLMNDGKITSNLKDQKLLMKVFYFIYPPITL